MVGFGWGWGVRGGEEEGGRRKEGRGVFDSVPVRGFRAGIADWALVVLLMVVGYGLWGRRVWRK